MTAYMVYRLSHERILGAETVAADTGGVFAKYVD
jgi:hypothetical protein